MYRLLLASTVLLSMGSVALAADAVYSDPVVETPASAYNWSGFYIGAHAGYAWGDYTLFSASGGGPNVDVDGFVGGATIGYNWQWDYLVLGIEADISNGPDGTTSQGTAGPVWSCITGDCNAEIEYFGTVRGRLGVAFDRWLVYGTAGYAYGEVEGGIENSAQQGGGSADGWAAGLGTEFGWTEHWSTKAEYLHVDLGDIPFGTGVGTEDFEGDGDFDVFRLRVNYRF